MPPGVTAPFGYLIDMATVTRTFLDDDLDGSTEDVQNVQISLDGTNFEIDRSAANAARLRGKLAKYVDHGTRVTPQKTRRSHRVVKPPVVGPGPGPGGAGLGPAERVQGVGSWAHPQEHPGRLRRRPLTPVYCG